MPYIIPAAAIDPALYDKLSMYLYIYIKPLPAVSWISYASLPLASFLRCYGVFLAAAAFVLSCCGACFVVSFMHELTPVFSDLFCGIIVIYAKLRDVTFCDF